MNERVYMEMEDVEYGQLVQDGNSVLLGLKGRHRHPTRYIIDLIAETYGHEVSMRKLIELIETSPLNR